MGTIFSMSDIRGRADDSLTTEYVWNIGKALADWLPEQGYIVIVKGEAANESTVHAFVEGVLLQGRNVVDAGLGDQQTLVAQIGDRQAAGGVLFTHDALQDSEVIAFTDARGASITTDSGLTELGQLAEAGNFEPAATKGQVTQT